MPNSSGFGITPVLVATKYQSEGSRQGLGQIDRFPFEQALPTTFNFPYIYATHGCNYCLEAFILTRTSFLLSSIYYLCAIELTRSYEAPAHSSKAHSINEAQSPMAW